MQVLFTKQFEKEIKGIKDKKVALLIEGSILSKKKAGTISEVPNIKKRAGYKNAYRIRIKDYRVGIYLSGNVAVFSRFLHRKEMYRYFP